MHFDGDPSLPLQIHGVEVLILGIAVRHRPRHLEESIREGGFPMVDVGDDTKVTNEGK